MSHAFVGSLSLLKKTTEAIRLMKNVIGIVNRESEIAGHILLNIFSPFVCLCHGLNPSDKVGFRQLGQ